MTVLEAVQRSGTPTFMNKGSIKAAQEMLFADEEIIWAMSTIVYTDPVRGELSTEVENIATDILSGVIVVTGQRILFVHKVLGNRSSCEMRISAIRSMDTKTNLTLEVLRIVGTSGMIVTRNKRKHSAALRNAITEAGDRCNAAHATPSAQADSRDLQQSDIEQLQTLKQLCDSGVITPEEFAAKKAQILGL